MSLIGLTKMTNEELKNQRFYINKMDQTNETNLRGVLMIKLTQYNKDNDSQIMIQLVDISQNLELDQKVMENEMLQIVNATTSHELRNPLSSMIAQNTKKEELYKEMKDIAEQKGYDEINWIIKELQDSSKI